MDSPVLASSGNDLDGPLGFLDLPYEPCRSGMELDHAGSLPDLLLDDDGLALAPAVAPGVERSGGSRACPPAHRPARQRPQRRSKLFAASSKRRVLQRPSPQRLGLRAAATETCFPLLAC